MYMIHSIDGKAKRILCSNRHNLFSTICSISIWLKFLAVYFWKVDFTRLDISLLFLFFFQIMHLRTYLLFRNNFYCLKSCTEKKLRTKQLSSFSSFLLTYVFHKCMCYEHIPACLNECAFLITSACKSMC